MHSAIIFIIVLAVIVSLVIVSVWYKEKFNPEREYFKYINKNKFEDNEIIFYEGELYSIVTFRNKERYNQYSIMNLETKEVFTEGAKKLTTGAIRHQDLLEIENKRESFQELYDNNKDLIEKYNK